MNKPLTQSEIDATGLLDGWTVDMDGYLCDADGHLLSRERNKAITNLVRACLANRLEAAPLIEQPPVEQSEPTHPLHAGYVILDGEKRELRRFAKLKTLLCPFCFCRNAETCDCDPDNDVWIDDVRIRLAPAAVIEPEPPKCRTCEGVGLILGFGACPEGCAKSRELYREKWEVIDAVREIRSRKGDK